jgi:hypothetical protein
MINEALVFVAAELNSFLKSTFSVAEDKVTIASIVNIDGSVPVKNLDKIVITLINIEHETSIRNMPSIKVNQASKTSVHINPPLHINLSLLFSASFTDYQEALKFISGTISFFQGRYLFDKQSSPKLNPGIEKLIFELDKTTYQEWSFLWGMLGGRYLPSVIYKMRMLTIQENVATAETPLIREVDYKVNKDENFVGEKPVNPV